MRSVFTVVYEDAGAGGSRPTIPSLPGTISWGQNQPEVCSNAVDPLRTMLSVEPENMPDRATTERVRASLWPSHGVRLAIWVSTAELREPGPDSLQ
jgi:hypothetical protein